MPQSNHSQLLQNEGKICLAMQAINQRQILSTKAAAKIYEVPRTTLRNRRAGIPSRRDCTANSRKLDNLEEHVILQHVIDLDNRGFAPRLAGIEDMANKLLASRNGGSVGVNWASNFVKRTPELKMRYNRKYDYQRAKMEDPIIIQAWFDLVRNMKAKFGILDGDTYNFDEIGFMMGLIATAMVVTASERRQRPKAIQPGNREWVTVIQAVNALGWAIPPFIIFAGILGNSSWFSDEIPRNWSLNLSENGWTTNELGYQWLLHFDKHTKARTTGVYRLLILDGHESHHSLKFQEFCKMNNIITLCMPAHSSHLLQPLDVGCFGPLKKAYGRQIEDLIRYSIHHITKLEFLPAFRAAFDKAITKDNIQGAFRGSGLIPFDPDAVISKLDIQIRTPTPPAIEPQWESKTPSNAIELAAQTELIQGRLTAHQNSSPTPINNAINQFLKGAQAMVHSMTILQAENEALRKANQLATQRRKRQKKQIRMPQGLTIEEGQAIIDEMAINSQIAQEMQNGRVRYNRATPRPYRCGRCREVGHRIQTCPQGQ